MAVISSDPLVNSSDISIIIDDKETISTIDLKYSHRINAARIAEFSVNSLEDSLKCRIGAKITVFVGRVPPNINSMTNDATNFGYSYTNHYHFQGIIRQVTPTPNGANVIAYDYISLLKTSQIEEFKPEDVIGRDLFTLIADAANIEQIDTSNLVGGIGIDATAEMGLTGLKTRKEFIDLCIANSVSVATDSSKYFDAINPVYYQYAIKTNNVFDIYKLDPDNVNNKPVLSVSLDSNNAYDISPTIDTQRLINSLTVENQKIGLVFTHNDNSSISQYGVVSNLVSTNETRREVIETTAFEIVSRFSKPTIKYEVQISNENAYCLGQYVSVTSNIVGERTLPIQGINTDFSTGKTKLTLGEKELSAQELIRLVR
tara:strand:+ start:1830 stop:2948 length:1119 start_codon:yes stop_codon:yes gene_type:complete